MTKEDGSHAREGAGTKRHVVGGAAADREGAGSLAQSVWPWVQKQRWAPQTPGQEPRAEALFELETTAPDSEVWILVLRLHPSGTMLQIPLVTLPAADGRDPQPAGVTPEATREQTPEETPEQPPEETREVVGQLENRVLVDGCFEPAFWQAWAAQASIHRGARDQLIQSASKVRPMGKEQSNTSVFLEGGPQALVAKVFRVLHPGSHPEVELPAALSAIGWRGVPAVWASWDLPPSAGQSAACSAVVSSAIPGANDGFDLFVDLAKKKENPHSEAFALGVLVGEMHQNLKTEMGEGTPLPQADLKKRLEATLLSAREEGLPRLTGSGEQDLFLPLASWIKNWEVADAADLPTTRIHGDLHLGQTLRSSDGDWVLLDFEGEPLRPLAERRLPDAPQRDVAGMLRSFDYAWSKGQSATTTPTQDPNDWLETARGGFLDGYTSQVVLSQEQLVLLDLLEAEKAIYEVAYEARFRPYNLPVPLAALEKLIQSRRA